MTKEEYNLINKSCRQQIKSFHNCDLCKDRAICNEIEDLTGELPGEADYDILSEKAKVAIESITTIGWWSNVRR